MSAIVFIGGSDELAANVARARGERMLDLTLIVADGGGDRTLDGITVLDVGAVPHGRLAALMDRSVVGRTLVRLSPADGGARLRRRIRRSRAAMAVLERADVVVACQRDAVFTAWSICRQRGTAVLGLYGVAAGLAELRRR